MQPCVYMLASRRNGTLYVGVTSNLVQRIWQHKQGLVEGFTKRYKVHSLVWFCVCDTMEVAIQHEKRVKHYTRKTKIALIEATNPYRNDLYSQIV